MKKIFALLTACMAFGNLWAQPTAYNALNLSTFRINGSANYISRAGALGAVGGDLTTASYNPAGLGLYNRNEISMSMGLHWGTTTSNDMNNSSDNRVNFEVGSLGTLFYFQGNKKSAAKAFQFAFTLNRMKSFGSRTIFSKDNASPAIDYLLQNDDNFLTDALRTGAAYQDSTNTIYTDFPYEASKQLRSYTESGYIEEMGFSFSTNLMNTIYLGATLGIPLGEYHNDMQFEEETSNTNGTYRYIYNTTQDLYIAGINLKLGAIYRPFSFMRLGLAIHTPTYYSIQDNLYSEVQYNTTSGGDWPQIEYSLESPFRTLASVAFIIGNNKSPIKGTLSADYEWADYSNMKYHYSNNIVYQNNVNNSISNYYKAANTFRFGGELKIGSQLALRAGYMTMSDAYKSNVNQSDGWAITGGIGYNNRNFFIDFAYAYTQGNQKYNEFDGSVIKLDRHYSLG